VNIWKIAYLNNGESVIIYNSGLNGIRTRDLWIPVQCSTKIVSSQYTRRRWRMQTNIWKIIYLNCGGRYEDIDMSYCTAVIFFVFSREPQKSISAKISIYIFSQKFSPQKFTLLAKLYIPTSQVESCRCYQPHKQIIARCNCDRVTPGDGLLVTLVTGRELWLFYKSLHVSCCLKTRKWF